MKAVTVKRTLNVCTLSTNIALYQKTKQTEQTISVLETCKGFIDNQGQS